MTTMRKVVFYLIGIFLFSATSFSQTTQYDHTRLSWTGASLVTDATSLRGTVIKRAYATGDATAWWGPYAGLQAGSYQVQFRLKVSSNISTDPICSIDVWSNATGVRYNFQNITPSMFARINEWQTFTLTVQIPVDVPDIELRGMEFKANLNTDLYIDYINVVKTQDFFVSNFLVTGTGKVGIGTTTPQATLAVNGDIYCKKIKVTTTGWPDYVFQQNYHLPPLKEVAEYIKQNNHLPEVPSADEVQRDGLNLGDNQATLLKKIEELTLYAIEQNKRLEAQQQQLKEQQMLIMKLNSVVETQQKSINTLEKRVK
jgi:hypothetical protein